MRDSTFVRLWPLLGMAMLVAALAPAADPLPQGPAAPADHDTPPDLSFIPGKPRPKPIILQEEVMNKGGKSIPRGCVRLQFLDQGKILESRRDNRSILKPSTLPQPGGAVFFQPFGASIYSQHRFLWDARDGKQMEQKDECNGPPNQQLTVNQNVAWHRDAAGFDLRQICRAGSIELLLRYKAFEPLQPRKVVVVDGKTGRELRVVGPLQANAASKFNATADLEFTRDGTVMLEWNLANGGRALELRFWDLTSGQAKKSWQIPVQTASKVPARPVTKGRNWEGEDPMPRLAAWNTWQATKPVFLSPDGKLLAVRDKADLITLWDTAAQKQSRNFAGYALRGFSPNGKCLIAVHNDNKDRPGICLLDCDSGKETRVCDASHIGVPQAGLIAVSADNARLATYRQVPKEFVYESYQWLAKPMQAEVHVWDTATGKEVYCHSGHQSGVCGLAISPQGRTVASSDWGGDIHIWEVLDTAGGPMLGKRAQDNGDAAESRSAAIAAAEKAALAQAEKDAAAEKAAAASAEKSAAAKLSLAKQLVDGGGTKSMAVRWLKELIAKYPMTQAANEARRLLKDWAK